MKRFVVAVLAVCLMLMTVPASALAETGAITAGKNAVAFDVEPTVVDGVLMVPIRAVAEALGGKVTWQQENKTAIITGGATTVELTVGKAEAKVNGDVVTLAAPVILQENRTLVPASFLMTLYGDKLTVTYAGVKDPVAMALLEKNTKPTADQLDVRQDSQLAMVVRVQGATAKELPESMNLKMGVQVEGQVRGQDSLLATSLRMESTPAVAGMEGPVEQKTVVATRGGKAWVQADGKWESIPTNVAVAEAAQSLEGVQGLVKMVKEAHLGASRTVAGRKLQDVVITYDTAAIKSVMDQLTAQIMSGGTAEFVWENLSATLTLDAETGEAVGMVMDAAVSIRFTMDGETATMHETMHQTTTMTASKQPIKWPADLP